MDCANFSLTELQELQFQCNGISMPGLCIAVAVTPGLAIVGSVGVTSLFNMTKNPPRKLQEVCCCSHVNGIPANRIYFTKPLSKTFIISASLITACLVWSNFHSTLYSMQKQTHIYYSSPTHCCHG